MSDNESANEEEARNAIKGITGVYVADVYRRRQVDLDLLAAVFLSGASVALEIMKTSSVSRDFMEELITELSAELGLEQGTAGDIDVEATRKFVNNPIASGLIPGVDWSPNESTN